MFARRSIATTLVGPRRHHRGGQQQSLSTRSTKTTTLGVIGGGLSGLASAVYFVRTLSPRARERTRVVVFERQNRVGGWCHAVRLDAKTGERVSSEQSLIDEGEGEGERDTLVFETGPRSIRPVGLQGWLTIELVHHLGLTRHLLTVEKTHASAKNRYLYRGDGHPVTVLPNSIASIVRDLFRPRSLMRRVLPGIVLEPFRKRSKLHTSGHGDESVDGFFARRFGKPLAEDMVSAMVHGIYAGDSRRLSVRAVFPQLWDAEREFGSVVVAGIVGGFARKRGWTRKSEWRLNAERDEQEVEKVKQRIRDSGPEGTRLVDRMERASVWGVKGGLEEIAIRMRRWLEARGVEFKLGELDGKVDSIERQGSQWHIRTARGESIEASHVITTLPHLLPSSFSPPSFPATTVSVVNLAFRRRTPKSVSASSTTPWFPRGFGYLIPRTVSKLDNPHDVLGVLFDSDVMPDVDSSDAHGIYKCSLILGGSHWLDPSPESTKVVTDHDVLVAQSLETLSRHFPNVAFDADEGRTNELVHAFTTTHRECIPQVGVNSRDETIAFAKRVARVGHGTVGIVGGGFAAVGVNGAVKAASDVATAFANQVNDDDDHLEQQQRDDCENDEDKEKKARKRGIKRAVRTGLEMWQL